MSSTEKDNIRDGKAETFWVFAANTGDHVQIRLPPNTLISTIYPSLYADH